MALPMLVSPASAQWILWWMSHQAAGGVAVPVLAVSVSGDDGASLRGGEGAGGAAGVEDLTRGSGDDPGDGAVAGEHPGGVTGDDGPEPEGRAGSTLSLGEGGVVDDHGHVRRDPAGVGELAGF
jgi:hypothetical protein